ncbi:hypothetical protein B0H16DRAFT_1706775 [Mycena metata]|uniref:Uncharacterized protein n=1 Tax=Mycena metata TaxID=1033252 RepID=A0AAD7GMH6_9AGAR|nr:hypothetical protein B0H16DRAFT_1706775 [Mycena metata]
MNILEYQWLPIYRSTSSSHNIMPQRHVDNGDKRKRSLQDSRVDPTLTRLQKARTCLVALQEQLDGVVETASEITAIGTRVDALQAILGTAKERKIEFSAVTKTDLANVGIQRKFFQFDVTQLQKLLTHERAAPAEQIQQLCTRVAQIYRHVGMHVRTVQLFMASFN